jgi:protein-tyrosine phosphatase
MTPQFVDIHCHLLPGVDDGARTLEESLAMARMAVDDGIGTIVATPHQLGNFAQNRGDELRRRVTSLQQALEAEHIPLNVLAGADVRIEAGLSEGLRNGDVLSLADRRKHVLLELPHELYLPLEPVLDDLARLRMVGILSHPERNQGLLRRPDLLPPLVERGCLMQVTAGSLCGTFGPAPQKLAEQMLADGLVHFVATDAHGVRSRRPLMRRAFERVAELTDSETALDLCCHNPAQVATGHPVPSHRRRPAVRPRRSGWFGLRKAA